MTKVPCLFVEDLTDEQKRAYILADNKLALDAGWDDEILRMELAELKELNFDISLTGFEDMQFDDIDISGFFEDGEQKEKEPKKI